MYNIYGVKLYKYLKIMNITNKYLVIVKDKNTPKFTVQVMETFKNNTKAFQFLIKMYIKYNPNKHLIAKLRIY